MLQLAIETLERAQCSVFAQTSVDSVGRIERKRLRLAQLEQPQDVIQIPIRQDHTLDRRVPEASGPKLAVLDDLTRDVGRRIQQEPMLVVSGDRDRILGS